MATEEDEYIEGPDGITEKIISDERFKELRKKGRRRRRERQKKEEENPTNIPDPFPYIVR